MVRKWQDKKKGSRERNREERKTGKTREWIEMEKERQRGRSRVYEKEEVREVAC